MTHYMSRLDNRGTGYKVELGRFSIFSVTCDRLKHKLVFRGRRYDSSELKERRHPQDNDAARSKTGVNSLLLLVGEV